MKKNVLICLDRDGTMIYDDGNYHLGRQRNWKSLIKFLPGVISGIKRLKKIDNVKIYMLTNQPGVARSDFPLLTFDKSLEVCVEILNQLERKGAGINGYEICPHMSPVDARKYKGVKFKKGLMCNCKCIKPKIGMVRDALDEEGW
ncbi:MAG: hypothetical protein KC506_00505, partial [Nanoarchaeota archaeon]|nr:hypothetical protein [Nanoarchaeota archaeon]